MNRNRRIVSMALGVVVLLAALAVPAWATDSHEVTIYLVRHGKTLFNTIGKVQGYVDSPLTDAGIAGAEDTGMGLSGVKFDAAYASDRGRAVETAQIILDLNEQAGALPLHELKDLREMNYGKYEGTATNIWEIGVKALGGTFPEGMAQFPMRDIVNAIAASDETGACETYEETLERLMRGVHQIVSAGGSGNVLCVAHGGAISNIAAALGATVAGELPNASVTIIHYQDGQYTLGELGSLSANEAGAAMREANGGAVVYPEGKAPAASPPAPGPGKVNIYLVRHGKTLLNAAGRMQGIADAPLTPEGVQGAINTGLGMADMRFDAVYTSDLQRTTETVDLVLSQNRATDKAVPRTRLKDLREYSFGIYEADSQQAVFPLLMKAAEITDLSQLAEKGITFLGMYDLLATDENLVEKNAPFYERVNRALDRIAAEQSQAEGERNVLACVHGMVMGAIMDRFDISVEGEIPNAAVIQVVYQDGQYELVKDADGVYQNMAYQEAGAKLNPYVELDAEPEYPEIAASLNGEAVQAKDVNNVPYLPLAAIAKAVGADYTVDEAENAVILVANGRRLQILRGTNLFYVDTEVRFAEAPIFDAAPMDLVCTALGFAHEGQGTEITVK